MSNGTTPRRRVLLTVMVLLLVVVGGGAGAAYAAHFADRALPRTSLAGVPVTGMAPDEVARHVQQRFDDASVTLRTPGGPTRRERMADLGYTLDVDATLARVFAANRSWPSYATSLASGRDVDPVLRTSPAILTKVADRLVEQAGGAGADAVVRLAEDEQWFVTTPAVPGKRVVLASLRDAVARAARGLRSTTAVVELVATKPGVTTAQAQAIAAQANAMVATAITISDGTTDHAATAQQKAAWVTIPSVAGAPGTPEVVADKVRAWVDSIAEAAAVAPTDGVRTVATGGRVVSVNTQAADGRVVANAEEVAAAAAAALAREADYRGELSYEQVAAGWTDRPVAVGAEDLAYPANEGEKWIDVNLSAHTMTAYVGATVVRGPVAMVSGAAQTPTVVGTFRVYHKNPLMTMRGFNADGTRYVTPDVPWSAFFHEGYALHGAPWRSSFGYPDSKGCVNLPVDVAKWLYDWAPVGTAVVTHH